jgi:hypothetical protein
MDGGGIAAPESGDPALPAFLRPVGEHDYDFTFEYDPRQDQKAKRESKYGIRKSVSYVVENIGPLQRFVNWVSKIEWPTRPEPNEADWINKPTTSLGFGALILLNSFFMAIETEYPEPKPFWIAVEIAFIVIFSVEIILRLQSERKYYFLDAWNWLDVCVVSFGILGASMDIQAELYPDEAHTAQDLSLGTVLRVFRLMKLVRIIKLIRFFSELALLIQGVINSMKTLMWVLVFLAMVTGIFSIIFTKLLGQKRTVIMMAHSGSCSDGYIPSAGQYLSRLKNYPGPYEEFPENQAEAACQILEWFGSVSLSMLSLFMSATLEAWPAMCRLSMNWDAGGSVFYVPLWIIYIYFTNITLLNLITGVIVETVLQLARTDEIDAIEAQRKEKEMIRKHMIDIFKEADDDGNEEVTRHEFAEACKKQEVLEHLAVLEINPVDAFDLFDIVDVDQSDSISIFEFMDGFGRLKGPALAKHLLKVQCDAQRLYKNALDGIEMANGNLREQMKKLHHLANTQCNSWERMLQKVFCPDTVPWIENVDCKGAEAVFQTLREEVAVLAAFSPALQEALNQAGVDPGTPAAKRHEEVNVHARAFGANLSALQMSIGDD